MLKKTKRDTTIDALKGFAIVLVVLGHSIQGHFEVFDDSLVHKTISSFHMPLFMFLSGYVAFLSLGNKSNGKIISNKFLQLAIPFLMWSVFVKSLTFGNLPQFKEHLMNLVKSPDYGIWFLWVLFLIFLAFIPYRFLVKNIKNAFYEYGIILLFSIILFVMPVSVLGIGLLKWHIPFFLTGYWISKYKKDLIAYKTVFFEMALILFPILLIFFHRTEQVVLVKYAPFLPNIFNLAYRYLIAFMGIAVAFLFVKKLTETKLNSSLVWLGMYTLDIYVIHTYFLHLIVPGKSENILIILLSVVLAIGISLIISFYFLRQSKILSFLFLGIRGK